MRYQFKIMRPNRPPRSVSMWASGVCVRDAGRVHRSSDAGAREKDLQTQRYSLKDPTQSLKSQPSTSNVIALQPLHRYSFLAFQVSVFKALVRNP